MSSSPRTLYAWRELGLGEASRAAWEQFEPFFEQHGYKLFLADDGEFFSDSDIVECLVPRADCSPVRSEDEYSRFLPECLGMAPKPTLFFPQTAIHVGARTSRNTHVVIRILSIGHDGKAHLDIMRALTAPDAQIPENHALPMIAELQKDDIVFGIFPLMWRIGIHKPWYRTVREMLDALDQLLEGFTYLHQHLIAHRDFSFLEVFTNYGRDWDFDNIVNHCHMPPVFRSVCPDFRYFINDFELSVQFAMDSDPNTRLVTGVPIACYDGTAETYGKPLAPEANSDTPYCPFKADIYQFGQSALELFENVSNVAGLQDLFVAMGSDDPDARPSATQSLAMLRAIRQNASEDTLNDVPTHRSRKFRRLLPGETCDCRACQAEHHSPST